MYFRLGIIIIPKNIKYAINAGIPSVTAICRYSLCALSVIPLCAFINSKLSSVTFLTIPFFKLSGPTPKIGYFPYYINNYFPNLYSSRAKVSI